MKYSGMIAMGIGQGLIYIPVLFILKAALGVNGLVWAQPVADLLSIGLAALLYAVTFRKYYTTNMKYKSDANQIIMLYN